MRVNAVVSGQAGVALLVNGAELASLHAGRNGEIVPRRPAEARFLLGDAQDLQVLDNVELEEVSQRLDLATTQVDALHVALIFLDGSLSEDTREEAAQELDDFLADSQITSFLESIFFSRPLPKDADLRGAQLFCTGRTDRTRTFLRTLEYLQDTIREVHLAWEAIPLSTFVTEESRGQTLSVVVREGLFRDLVLLRAAGKSTEPFLINALLNKFFTQVRNSREIVKSWTSPLREDRVSARQLDYAGLQEEQVAKEAEEEDRKFEDRKGTFENVERQKASILDEMRRRRFDRVHEYVNDLIVFQLQRGEPEHACKSLCDLAVKAKNMGFTGLQLELTERSIKLKSDDAWSWAQYADALLRSGKLNEAMHAYDNAIAFKPDVEARNGRAEVLKAQNRLDDALAAYNAVIRDHPRNVVARNGRAEVLKAQNRLDDALAAYDNIIREHPGDVVARRGRAEVLKAQNRLDDALAAYDDIFREHPEDVVTRRGRAEVLKAQNRLDDALAAYDAVIRDHPGDVMARNGRAEVLKAQNRLDDALAAYDAVIWDHPEDVFARNGRAEVLKAQNRLGDALAAYDTVIWDHPEDVFARTGRAEVLKAQNRLDDALAAYDAAIRNHPENLVARTGRAEVLKAQNRLDDALAAYDAVVRDHPGDVVARNGRASVLAALERWDEALEYLPDTPPITEGDWIAYHIRGMILLRSGRFDEAIRIFDEGTRLCPRPSRRPYFQTALVLTQLQRRAYEKAEETLAEINAPTLEHPLNVLRFHAFGAQGKIERAREVSERLRPVADLPAFRELKAELTRRYIERAPAQRSDSWLIQSEMKLLLAA